MAVSTLAEPVVHGRRRGATVVAATRHGGYLLLDDGTEVLPVLTADALMLPTAVRLPWVGDGARLRLEQGERVLVGEGAVLTAHADLTVVRTVRPARVRRVSGCAPHTPLRPERVSRLLGRGPGLTPEGDDELAGHLLVLAAVGGALPDLEPHLARTTALSASLLRAAARGYAVPAVVGYVDAVVGRDPATARRLRPVVAGIGHTSGPALLRGIHHALDNTTTTSTTTTRTIERTVA